MFRAESRNDTEHDNHDHPTEPFKVVDELVSEQSNDERENRNEDNADDERALPIRELLNDLSADDRVDHGPSHTGDDIGAGEEHGAIPTEAKSDQLALIS